MPIGLILMLKSLKRRLFFIIIERDASAASVSSWRNNENPIVKCNESLLKRVLTAVILIPFILLGVFFLPPLSFAIITGLLLLIAAAEWPKLMGRYSTFNATLYITLVIIIMLLSYLLIHSLGYLYWVSQTLYLIIMLWWMLALLLITNFNRTGKIAIQHVLFYGIAGFFVIIPCWLGLNIIRVLHHGRLLVLYLLMLIWVADTAAYFIGKQWGNKKLAPRVSPKKTKVGVYGALLVTSLFSLIVVSLFSFASWPLQFWQLAAFVLLSLVTVLFSIVGDLFISILKRQHHLKDSGTLLPGHGGMLDRIDSLTAGAPIFAIGLILLGLQ